MHRCHYTLETYKGQGGGRRQALFQRAHLAKHKLERISRQGVQMKIEIIDEPIRFHLHGIGGVVENERFGEVGLRLMNEMWQVVKGAGISTTGINHWVYLPDGRMFVGVELRNQQQLATPDQLEPLEFELRRYMKHIHVGPY